MRSDRALPTVERIREVLSYDESTGLFTWLMRTSIRITIGAEAGNVGKKGYREIRVDGVLIKAHHIAWAFMTDSWPDHEIDHIDRVKLNNRWSNLRDGSGGVNYANHVDASANSKSGIRGVTWSVEKNKWRATFRSQHLGYFVAVEDASKAYLKAKDQGTNGIHIHPLQK